MNTVAIAISLSYRFAFSPLSHTLSIALSFAREIKTTNEMCKWNKEQIVWMRMDKKFIGSVHERCGRRKKNKGKHINSKIEYVCFGAVLLHLFENNVCIVRTRPTIDYYAQRTHARVWVYTKRKQNVVAVGMRWTRLFMWKLFIGPSNVAYALFTFFFFFA